MKWPLTLLKEAELDSYRYFDANIRPLPKKSDGTIDTLKPGFQDNDVDAFRHAYISGIFTLEYGEKVALVLGCMNEFAYPSSVPDRNMDLWNNGVGRSLAKKHQTIERLTAAVRDALLNGELIVTPADRRVYKGASVHKPRGQNSVVVIRQGVSGANEMFFDFETSSGMTRDEFVEKISKGYYPGYEVRIVSGVMVPVSKRDDATENNLG